MDSKELMAQAQAICQAAKRNVISYNEAKERVIPLLGVINKTGKKIATKYHMRYAPITFTSLMR